MERVDDVMRMVEECLKGNARSQRRLFKSFYGCAMGVCMRYAGNSEEAEDMLNEGFVKVFANLGKYRSTGPFEAWLKKVVANAALDYRRRFLKDVDLVNFDDMAYDIPDESVTSALSNMSAKETLELVQTLPETSRVVFNMFVFEGFTHAEIADRLGITEGTSAWHVNNARNRLKKMIMDK